MMNTSLLLSLGAILLSTLTLCAQSKAPPAPMLAAVENFCTRHGILLDRKLQARDIVRFDSKTSEFTTTVSTELITVQGYQFRVLETNGLAEIRSFYDRRQDWTRDFPFVPKEDWILVKRLPNSLTDAAARKLAENHFEKAGFKQVDFHPLKFRQIIVPRHNETQDRNVPLPFYVAEWFRRDVNMEDHDAGVANLPCVTIVVSGANSNMISFQRLFLPLRSVW